MEFLEYCDANKILVAVYPPHATHTLQPLDVSVFKPLSTAYFKEIPDFMVRSQGLVSMSKRDFFPLFWKAWQASFKEKTIENAFKATGLSPFHPEVILRRFSTAEALSGSNSDSDSSASSASNWRKIRKLINQAVDTRESRKVSKLHRALHATSVQNSLLKHETAGLLEAPINERTRRKRGKALPLETPEEYHGGAMFWSPRKVKEARERLQLKALEEEQLQHQKAEATSAPRGSQAGKG